MKMKKRKAKRNTVVRHIILLFIMVLQFNFVKMINDAPKFIVKPDSSTVIENTKISFFCRADGNPLPSIIWRLNGESVNNPRVIVKTLQNGFSTLRIDPVLISDKNTSISCIADNGVRQPIKTTALLTVLPNNVIPYGFPKVESHPILKSVEQGKTAHVSCRVTGEPRPKILWLRDMIPIDIKTNNRYSVSTLGNPGALMIQQAREEDQGKYECVARNGHGVVQSKSAQLYVKVRRVPPYFSYKLEKVYKVLKGGNVNLTCVAVGYPMPRVFWKRQSDEVLLNDPSTAPIGKNVLKLTVVEETANFTCIAVSKLGNIEASTTVVVKPLPETPKDLRVLSINSTYIILQWEKVMSEYDHVITHYVIRYRQKYSTEKNFYEKVVGNNETNTMIRNLIPFTQYEFMIASGSLLGIGKFSYPLEVQTDEDIPSTSPTNIHVKTISRTSLLVQWDSPITPNGKIIENKIYYTNNKNNKNVTKWDFIISSDSKNTITLDNLIPEDTYYLSIQSKTIKGYGPPSEIVSVVTKQGIPGEPINLQGKGIDSNKIQLTWEKPAQFFNIKGYVLHYNMTPDDINEIQLHEHSTKYVIDNLKENTYYSFKIAAKSSRGMGNFGNMITVKTLNKEEFFDGYVPPEPEDVKVEVINATTVHITWKEPSSYSGVILGYNVYKEKLFNGEPVDNKLHKAISVYPKEQLSAIITDLEPNTEYLFRVNAENKFGDGEHSNPVRIMMNGLPPSAPIIQSLSLINEKPPLTARIEWLPPKETYGKSITKYYLWYRPDIHTELSRIDVSGDERSIEIRDLIMFREYTFILAAATVDGVGANTTESLSTPAGIPSSPPLNVRYDIVRGKIIFAWDPPPLDQQNGNITYYKASLTSDSKRPLVKNVTEGTSIALAMPVKTTSTFKVAAATMSGLGPESPGLIIYPDASATVNAPTNVKVQATSNSSVVVLWDYDDKNFDSGVDGFVIKYIHEPSLRGPHHDVERWRSISIMDSKARSFEVGQLTAHKPYAFCVLTVKQSRQGPCSDPPVTIEQLKPLFIPSNLRIEYKTSNSVSLRWDYFGPNDVDFYVNRTSRKSYLDHNLKPQEMVSPGIRKILKGNDRSLLWDNLRPHMEHTFKVGVIHKDIYYWPREIIVQTDNTGPPFVDKPEFVESKSPTTMNVRLKCASEEYGPISHYWIIVVPSNYSQDNVNNLDSQTLKYHSETLKGQLSRDGYNSQTTSNVIKKVRRQSKPKDSIISITDNQKFLKRVTRYSGGALPTVPYVTAGISAQRMQIMQKEHELFTIGDGKIYEGFENFPLHPSSKYKLMMRSFAKEIEGKKAFSQRAPMNQPRAKKYADSMLTNEFSTSSSLLDRSSRHSSLWLLGPLIAMIIICIILGMLVIWWWKFSKKNVAHCGNRHGSITKVALTDSGKGVIPNEASKLLLGTDPYGRPIINAYDVPPNHNPQCNMGVMESSLIDVNSSSQQCDNINVGYKMSNGHVPTMYGSHDNYQDLPMPMPLLSDSANVIGRHNISRAPIPISELASQIDRLKLNGNQLFTQEYESIENTCDFTWEHSNMPYNKNKNRYANVVAYDHSRVILSTINGIPGSDYINANYIDGYDKPKAYIATQGPLPETFNDFWRMVWEEKSMTIVMLTKLEEMNRIKCDQYWPSRGSQIYGSIRVTILDTLELAHYIIRTFRIEHLIEKEIRDIRQMQYTSWPDHGVPDHTTPFLMFLKRVKTLNHPDAGPIISHCSAGIGRTGAFIVIDCMLERLRYDNTVDIYECVCNLRSQRCYMVQTDDQYIFIHDAVLDAVQSGSTEVPASKLFPHIQVLMQLHPLDQVSGMELEFRTLSSLRITNSKFDIATLPVNRSKNRNSIVIPYDSTRVILKMISGIEGSDYINANWIDGYRQRKAYIATQSPLQHTTNEFWRMLWETESSVIVMLTKLKELRVEKSYEYWPSEKSYQYGFLVVEPIAEYNMQYYILREFKMNDTQSGNYKTIRHFQYMDWPEHGVPESAEMFLEFVQQIHNTCSQFGIDGPITVHDHLGSGRAGVFIAVSIIIDRMKLEHVVDVFTTVKLLRIDRPMMVQEKEEYNFCYQAAFEFLQTFENPYLI